MIVDLLPNEEQSLIVASLSGWLMRALPVERLHTPDNLGGKAEVGIWPQFVELGLVGLGLDADQGGVGYSLIEEALAARELGRNLVSLTTIATMAAVHVAIAAGRQEVAAALIAGQSRATCANALGSLSGGAAEVQILDGHKADFALAWDREGCVLAPLDPLATWRRVTSIDDAVTIDRGELALAGAMRADAGVADRIVLMLAAYQSGIATATRDMAVTYAKVREQFGQPIGAFQGIKFACADMAVREEAAFAQIFYATVTQQAAGGVSPVDLGSARLLANQAAIENAKANVQTHGAMGFTFECDAHFYLKRANLVAALNGSRSGDQAAILS